MLTIEMAREIVKTKPINTKELELYKKALQLLAGNALRRP
jgi:hypothetical protein